MAKRRKKIRIKFEKKQSKKLKSDVRKNVHDVRKPKPVHSQKRGTQKKTTTPLVNSPSIFLPDYPDQVKAIAMRGLTDEEMAASFGISPDLLESWKKYYPGFAKAIEEGRTQADSAVVKALFDNAVGFEYDEDEIVRTRHGGEVHTVHKKKLPETQAIKFWLTNRAPRYWGETTRIGGERPPGFNGPHPIGLAVKAETKVEVMNSILNMISPKPDPV